MRCYICGKAIIIKRTIKTLFNIKPLFRCKSCTRRYPTYPFKQVIPKENGEFFIYSLFAEENNLQWLAFNDEVDKWFNKIQKKCKYNDFIFWLDKIDLRTLEILDKVGNDIYILTKEILII